jgi:hypothetical protein
VQPHEHGENQDQRRIGLHVESCSERAHFPASSREPSVHAVERRDDSDSDHRQPGDARSGRLAKKASKSGHKRDADQRHNIGSAKTREGVMRSDAAHHKDDGGGEEQQAPFDVVGAAHRLGGNDWGVDEDDEHPADHGTDHARTKRCFRQSPTEAGHSSGNNGGGLTPLTRFHCNVRA